MISDPTRMCRKERLGLHVALLLMHLANLEGRLLTGVFCGLQVAFRAAGEWATRRGAASLAVAFLRTSKVIAAAVNRVREHTERQFQAIEERWPC